MIRQRGVALIVVLAIVAMLSLVVVQLSVDTSASVKKSRLLVERVEADFALHSREVSMTFALLSTRNFGIRPSVLATDELERTWNFRGEPFKFDDATWSLSDEAGLLKLPYNQESIEPFRKLLLAMSVDPARVEQIVTAVRGSLIQEGKLFPFQSVDELAAIAPLSSEELNRLRDLTTTYPSYGVNLSTAPDEVLAVFFQGAALGSIKALAKRGDLNEDTYTRITGEDSDEFAVFTRSPVVRMKLSYQKGDVLLARETSLIIRPYQAVPVEYWHRRSVGVVANSSGRGE
jgi:type II secretory pathway component PulK